MFIFWGVEKGEVCELVFLFKERFFVIEIFFGFVGFLELYVRGGNLEMWLFIYGLFFENFEFLFLWENLRVLSMGGGERGLGKYIEYR